MEAMIELQIVYDNWEEVEEVSIALADPFLASSIRYKYAPTYYPPNYRLCLIVQWIPFKLLKITLKFSTYVTYDILWKGCVYIFVLKITIIILHYGFIVVSRFP